MNTETKLHDIKFFAEQFGCSPRKIQLLVAAGEFPAPIRIGRLIRWREEEVAAWVQSRAAAAGTQYRNAVTRSTPRGRPRNSDRGA
ncbi:helix-turn-helix transcriptional regulator [Acidiferrobacter thiooxydans]|uniref:Helix-turn-helix domain-containing protein n=1 Tax=Acidiferrobacter thiooxydans TaxID=163359 RepID=A0A368HBK4_9GAMM|nr:hypothetical protein C4900_07860 [Acidiferrobacter thiooxydans]